MSSPMFQFGPKPEWVNNYFSTEVCAASESVAQRLDLSKFKNTKIPEGGETKFKIPAV